MNRGTLRVQRNIPREQGYNEGTEDRLWKGAWQRCWHKYLEHGNEGTRKERSVELWILTVIS